MWVPVVLKANTLLFVEQVTRVCGATRGISSSVREHSQAICLVLSAVIKACCDSADSSSGALTAVTNAGNIDVYVDQTGTAELHTQQGILHSRNISYTRHSPQYLAL